MKAESERTEVIQKDEMVLDAVLGFIAGAKSRLDLCASIVGPRTGEEFVDALRAARRRGVRTRLLTEVTSDNLLTIRATSKYLEVRHITGLRGNSWAVSDDEYLSSLSFGEFKASFPVIRSNARTLVWEHHSIFSTLWSHGEPLTERAQALEAGTDLPEVELIRDPEQIKEMYLSLLKRAKEQVLLLLPTPAAFRRDSNIGMMGILERKALRGVKVKILTPVDAWTEASLSKSITKTRRISYRAIPLAETTETVTLLVVDRVASLSIEERAPADPDFRRAVGLAILSTSEPRVRQSSRFFERLWTENELRQAEASARQMEEASRKRAELMQDILTHDIRNFNQVARLNAELLSDEVKDNESNRKISAIIRAIDGSSKLIERAKKLGSILTTGGVDAYPVALKGSFERSSSLVKKSNPSVKIKVKSDLSGSVLADDLLDEVFVNLLSNSVKYTDGSTVRIEARQEKAELGGIPDGLTLPCWKLSISDNGRGIPDGQKASVFKRYLETAKGSGLGLSIVHALVTDRYRGKVSVRDRVAGDHTKGTTVHIWLPRA